jgi:hypothetical protein
MELLAYSVARPEIADGDVLLFRAGRGLFTRLIGIAGRSRITHAGMAAWWGDDLMCVHTVQFRGGVVDHLSALVEKSPGRIEVRRVKGNRSARYDRRRAVAEMKSIIGKPYGWRAILAASALHLPFVRWFFNPIFDDAANGRLPFCSAAVARAIRAGGIDPVPNLADGMTEPGDLDRSAALPLKFILTCDEVEHEAFFWMNSPTFCFGSA